MKRLLRSAVAVLAVTGCADATQLGSLLVFPDVTQPVSFPSMGGNGSYAGVRVPDVPNPVGAIPTLLGGEAGIKVHVGQSLWTASSYTLATNRNHVEEFFPNGAGKLKKIKELRPKWGAGRYMYRIGHGPSDGRHDYDYMTGYHFEQAWDKKGGYPYDDLRNALKEANTLDAEQLHVINFGTSNPEEAGRYVSFLNNPNDPNRSKYPVQNARFFELGNEISWSMVRGHNEYASNETQYAQRGKQFAQAMRKASTVPIQIGAVATTNSNWMGDGWSGGATTVKNILQTMGNDVDFLIYHGYPSWPMKKDGDLLTVMAQNEWNKRKLEKEIIPAIKQYQTHPVYIANTEFFTELYSDAARSRGMFGALYSADTLSLSFNHDIRIANEFCLDHGEQSDAAFFYNDDPNQVTPIFLFQKMLAEHWGDEVLKVETQNIPSVFVQGSNDSVDMPKLAVSAALGKGKKVYVMVVNRTNDSDVSARISTGLSGRGTLYRLEGNNGWDSRDASIKQQSVDVGQSIRFPRASVSIIELSY